MNVFDKIRGSLLAGAIGDSFGAPVEIFSLKKILEKTNGRGVTEWLPYDPADYVKWSPCAQAGVGVVTDDTCMTAATAAGLLAALGDAAGKDARHYLHQAYLKWGQHQKDATGDYQSRIDPKIVWPAWFEAFCFESGAGKSTLLALNAPEKGSPEKPVLIPSFADPNKLVVNNGCGSMMRVAPVGWFAALGFIDDAYGFGCSSAALTHGDALAMTASGGLAFLIADLTRGTAWPEAVERMLKKLQDDPKAKDCVALAEKALAFGETCGAGMTFADVERLPLALGSAEATQRRSLFRAPAVWAQSLGVAAAVQSRTGRASEKFGWALPLAVTHSGDSDSVGAIVGNILGAAWGSEIVSAAMAGRLQNIRALEGLVEDIAVCEALRPKVMLHGVPAISSPLAFER